MKRKWLIAAAIIVAMLAICAGIVWIGWFTVQRINTTNGRLVLYRRGQVYARAEEQQVFTVTGPAQLSVDGLFGNIHVTGGRGNRIVVTALKTAWGADQADANAALAQLHIQVSQDGNKVQLKAEQDGSNVVIGQARADSIQFTITVPTRTSVDAVSRHGDVTLANTQGDVDIKTDFGSIDIRTIQQASVRALSRNGRVVAYDIHVDEQPIELRSDFGPVTLKDSNGETITLHSRNGPIALENIKASGVIYVNDDFGPVNVNDSDCDQMSLKTRNGALTLQQVTVRRDLTAQSEFGNVTLSNVNAGNHDLRIRNGRVQINGANGPLAVANEFGDIDIRDTAAPVLALSTRNGSITFDGSPGRGPHTIRSDFGNIKLRVPSTGAFAIDLQTSTGRITSDFEVTFHGTPDAKHWAGKINSGSNSLKVTARNGDIALEMRQQ